MSFDALNQMPALQTMVNNMYEEALASRLTASTLQPEQVPILKTGELKEDGAFFVSKFQSPISHLNVNRRPGSLYIFDYGKRPLIQPATRLSESSELPKQVTPPSHVFFEDSQKIYLGKKYVSNCQDWSNDVIERQSDEVKGSSSGSEQNGGLAPAISISESPATEGRNADHIDGICQQNSLAASLECPTWMGGNGIFDDPVTSNIQMSDYVQNTDLLTCHETWESFQHEILDDGVRQGARPGPESSGMGTRPGDAIFNIDGMPTSHKQLPNINKLIDRRKRPTKLLQSSMKRYELSKPSNSIGKAYNRQAGIYYDGVLLQTAESDVDNRGGSNQPSRFCHICLRRAERVPLMACGRLRSGLCRKVVCEKCFAEFGYDWDVAARPQSEWTCTHCRKICPPRAQCFIYKRTNGRRHQALAKRRGGLRNVAIKK